MAKRVAELAAESVPQLLFYRSGHAVVVRPAVVRQLQNVLHPGVRWARWQPSESEAVQIRILEQFIVPMISHVVEGYHCPLSDFVLDHQVPFYVLGILQLAYDVIEVRSGATGRCGGQETGRGTAAVEVVLECGIALRNQSRSAAGAAVCINRSQF